jgi:hypothetical protein
MPITTSEIEYRLSGGTNNTDPDASLGGGISTQTITTGVDNNLFDDVSGDEADSGDINYRCFYIMNTHGTITWRDVKVWIQSLTTSADDELDIGEAPEGTNGTAELVGDESSAPTNVTFYRPTNKTHSDALQVGNLTPDDFFPIWVRRTVDALASAKNANSGTIRAEGDTSE